jgi:dTDP-4-amino-4,6-dideoxygalactose transaminase
MSDALKGFAGGLLYYRGRVALHALLKGLGVGEGHHVALQAFTCLAVPEGIMATGATPLYVDIQHGGFNLDAEDLRRRLTPSTRAIVVQHTFGIPAEMDALLDVARKAEVPVIEDCCHTFASEYRGRRVGTMGAGAFYSFEWGKPVVTGIGGAAQVNDMALGERLRADYAAYVEPPRSRQLRLRMQTVAHRILYRPRLFWTVRALYRGLGAMGAAESNYNPISVDQVAPDFGWRLAAPLRRRLERQLGRLEDVTRHAEAVAASYREGIDSPEVRRPAELPGTRTVYCRYPLRARAKAALLREARRANVELAEWYATPVHPLGDKELGGVHYRPGSCPEAEARCREIVTLPTHPAVGGRDVERTLAFLRSVQL